MRERLRQLGSALKINSNGRGTVVEARMPIATPATVAALLIALSHLLNGALKISLRALLHTLGC